MISEDWPSRPGPKSHCTAKSSGYESAGHGQPVREEAGRNFVENSVGAECTTIFLFWVNEIAKGVQALFPRFVLPFSIFCGAISKLLHHYPYSTLLVDTVLDSSRLPTVHSSFDSRLIHAHISHTYISI
jgi:hypothetical protein